MRERAQSEVNVRARRGLRGATVLAFQSRRSGQLEDLIRRHGGEPIVAPSMREVPLAENPEALALLGGLQRRELDVVVLQTGVGVRALARLCREHDPPLELAELLRDATLVARGPKPTAELRKLTLTPQVRVAEPYTWRELLVALDSQGPLDGRRVAVLEYGAPDDKFEAALRGRGAAVMAVPLYRWALPVDQAPLREGVARLARADADVALFTSGAQVDHVMEIAQQLGLREAISVAARRLLIASIGPVCSVALRRHGLPVHVEPQHPKVGHLLLAVARHLDEA